MIFHVLQVDRAVVQDRSVGGDPRDPQIFVLKTAEVFLAEKFQPSSSLTLPSEPLS
jgi:hypothetical protein